MNYINQLEQWGNTHHPKWFDYVRILLGVFLCFKAILFLVDMSFLVSIMRAGINKDVNAFAVVFLGQFVVIVTLLSGILLALGIHTRLVCLIQIPIMIGAIILLNNAGNTFTNTWDLLLTVLTLVLLVAFMIIGNGPLSYSRMFQEENKKYRDEHPGTFQKI